MGTVDMSSGQRFERRIGRRIEVDPVQVTFFVPETGRFRKKVAAHEVPAHIENVSITGAAILAPETLSWSPGDRVVVRSQGADNVVVVRHRHQTPDGTRFGVELTRSATTLKRQIQQLLAPHLVAPPVAPVAEGPVLGLRKAPAMTNPVLPHLPGPAAEAPDAPVPDAPSGPLHGPGPVVDLSGPEPVIDITDGVMGLPPDDAEPEPEPEPVAAIEPEAIAEPEPEPIAEPIAEAEPEAEPVAAIEPEVEPVAAIEPEVEPVAAIEPEPEPEIIDEPAEVTAEAEERVVAPHAPAPHLPHSPGRQILDDVFGLMQD